jgi:hypothetical protein
MQSPRLNFIRASLKKCLTGGVARRIINPQKAARGGRFGRAVYARHAARLSF